MSICSFMNASAALGMKSFIPGPKWNHFWGVFFVLFIILFPAAPYSFGQSLHSLSIFTFLPFLLSNTQLPVNFILPLHSSRYFFFVLDLFLCAALFFIFISEFFFFVFVVTLPFNLNLGFHTELNPKNPFYLLFFFPLLYYQQEFLLF